MQTTQDQLAGEQAEFESGFVKAASVGILVCSAVMAVVFNRGPDGPWMAAACLLGTVSSFAAWVLVRRGYLIAGTHTFVVAVLVAACLCPMADLLGHGEMLGEAALPASALVTMVVIPVAAFVLGGRATIAYALGGILSLFALAWCGAHTGRVPSHINAAVTILATCLIVVEATCLLLFIRQQEHTQSRLVSQVHDIERMVRQAKQVAEGDLSSDIEGEGLVSDVLRAMVDALRSMVGRTQQAMEEHAAATAEIAAMARQQAAGSAEQAASVGQIRKSLAQQAELSRKLATATEEVSVSADTTKSTNEQISTQIAALAEQTQRMHSLLELIKEVASKSEILALNASLEGARAGEAGAGFSIVAGQMQGLAESVSLSVRDVTALVKDIESATYAAVAATEQGIALASMSSDASREISSVSQRQSAAAEEVSDAIQGILDVAYQMSHRSEQTLGALADLTQLSRNLDEMIGSFHL